MTIDATLYRALSDLVVKTELELAEQDEMRQRNYLPARTCACDSLRAGPGCKPCLVKRGRAAMAEYEASAAVPAYEPVPTPNEMPCSECGRHGNDMTIQYAFDESVTAQCRACYVAMREREMAGAL